MVKQAPSSVREDVCPTLHTTWCQKGPMECGN